MNDSNQGSKVDGGFFRCAKDKRENLTPISRMRSFVHSSSSASLMSSSVSELPVYHGDSPKKRSASEKRYKYLRRILMFRQMDFEFAVWQVG